MPVQPVQVSVVDVQANVSMLPVDIQYIGGSVSASQGSFGTPSESNRFITETDPRISKFNLELRAIQVEA